MSALGARAMSALGARLRVAALLAALVGLGGPTECAPPADEIALPPATATLKLTALPSYPGPGSTYYAVLILQATVSAPAQAYDLDVVFTPGVAVQALATPNTAFSDDAVLVAPGTAFLSQGVLTQILDVRHGVDSALSGNLSLAYVVIQVGSRVPIWVQTSGELARQNGILFSTTPSMRLRVLPPPS